MHRYRYGKVEFHNIIDDMGRPHPEHHGSGSIPPIDSPSSDIATATMSGTASGSGLGTEALPFGAPTSAAVEAGLIPDPVTGNVPQGGALNIGQSGLGVSLTNPNAVPPVQNTWGDLGQGLLGAAGTFTKYIGLGETTDTSGQLNYQQRAEAEAERTKYTPDPVEPEFEFVGGMKVVPSITPGKTKTVHQLEQEQIAAGGGEFKQYALNQFGEDSEYMRAGAGATTEENPTGYRYGITVDGQVRAVLQWEVEQAENFGNLPPGLTGIYPATFNPYTEEETSAAVIEADKQMAVGDVAPDGGAAYGQVGGALRLTTEEGRIAPSFGDAPVAVGETVTSPDIEPAEGAVVTAQDAAVAANEVRGKSIDEITSEDIASMRMQGTFTDPSSGEPTRFSMTSPAGLDIMMGWNNDALMADPGSHNYLHNLVAAQEKSEISVPVGYEVYADQSGTLRLKMQAGVMPHAFGNFAATIQDPTYLAKVEQALNQNRMVTERINQKMKADFDIELRAQNPEIQEELTRKAEKHDAEMEMYSDNSEVQIANLSGLFRDERTGIMTDTMDKKKLVAELTGKWGELDTMDKEKMIADLTGKYGEDTTIDYQKWQSDVTGYAMSPDGSRQIRTIMGQQTDIMEQRAKSEMLEIAGKALINTGKFDPETGEEIMEEMNSLKRDIHEHDKLIDQAKMMGWQAMEVQAKDADGKLLTNEDGTPMMVDKQVATLEREKMDIQGQQFTQVQALERAKMLSDTTGYVYKPVKKNGKWTVEQTGAATLGRAEINMRKTVANIAATAQTTVATTQKESAKKVAEINATSAKAVQTLKNNAIKLGIDNEITLLEKRIEQEFANAGIAATAASTARIAEYEMRKELVQAEIDAALDKETIEFDRQQAAKALEFTNNLAKEEAFRQLELTAQDQFVIDKLEADQAYQLELKKISDAAAIAGETERGEQARLTQTDVAADELAALQERAKEERATATSAQTIQKDIMAEEQRLAQQALEQRETYMSGVREQERGFLAIKPGEGVEGAKQLSNSFVTQLNSAIAGAVESGSYEDVGTVLGAALPPAPAGIVWDRASGAFQQRAGFEGREMDFATQQWMAAVTPAFKARDRAEQAIGVAQQLQVESMNRINERRQSEDDFRQAMLTADIDSAEEAIARQKMAETAAIATEQKMQHVQMLFNLLQNPVQLGMAKRHGLLGQIESVLGFTMNNVPTAEAGGAGVPTANAWQTMDSENQAFSIAAYVEQGGSPDDFMRMIASSVPAQMQQLQYGVL